MHFNLEGTRHEKVVLVILAYVLGFTAGYITFGIQKLSDVEPVAISEEVTNYDTMTTEGDDSEMTADEDLDDESNTPAAGEAAVVKAFYENNKLQAQFGDTEVLLSASKELFTPDEAALFSAQGMHTAIPYFLAEPAGNFIYFCEQKQAEEVCNHFVFDVQDNTTHFVKVDDKNYTSENAVAKTAVWDETGLVLGDYHSENPATPWILTNI